MSGEHYRGHSDRSSAAKPLMRVRYTCHVRDLKLGGPPFTIETGDSPPVRLTFEDTRCLAEAQFEAPRKVVAHFDGAAAEVTAYKTFGDQVLGHLCGAARRGMGLVFWVFGNETVSGRATNGGLEISRDGLEWKPLPCTITLKLVPYPMHRIATPESVKEVQTLAKAQAEEPLGHELLREAWSILDSAPRSALVMGVAAVETGIKGLISQLAPDTAWLLKNVPSPPVEKLFQDFLPSLKLKLTVRGMTRGLPTSLEKKLKKAVALRNQIVHGHPIAVGRDDVQECLSVVHDCLYLLALYGGHAWAQSLIEPDTIQEINKATQESLRQAESR